MPSPTVGNLLLFWPNGLPGSLQHTAVITVQQCTILFHVSGHHNTAVSCGALASTSPYVLAALSTAPSTSHTNVVTRKMPLVTLSDSGALVAPTLPGANACQVRSETLSGQAHLG